MPAHFTWYRHIHTDTDTDKPAEERLKQALGLPDPKRALFIVLLFWIAKLHLRERE